MKKLLYQYLTRSQIILFSCCMALATIYPFKYIDEIQPVILVIAIPILLYIVNRGLQKINHVKNIYRCLFILYLLLIVLQLTLFYVFPMATAYNDGAQIRNEAISLFYQGHFSGERYFLTYPNNINITLLLYGAYQLFAPLNFYIIEHMMTMISYHIMLISMLVVAYRYFNIYQAVKLLFLFILALPLHMYLLYFYTDTIVWCIPALILLIVGWNRNVPQLSWLRFSLVVIVLLCGYLIKQNIILLLPALVIYLWFCGAWKKASFMLILVVACLQLILPSVQNFQEKYGFYQDDHYRFPYVHWVMMGISESTFYNWQDYQYTYSQPDYDAKVAADMKVIKSRLLDRPIWRTLLVPIVSLDTSWSDGTLYAVNSVRVNTEGSTDQWRWLFGSQRQAILYIMQGIYIVILFNVVSSLRRIKEMNYLNLLIQITLLGVMTFHIFWESNPRYIVIWYPYILLLSLYQPNKIKWCFNPKIIYSSAVMLLLGIIGYSAHHPQIALQHDYYVKTGLENSAYATDYYLQQQSLIQHTKVVRQTFQVNKAFNFIDVVATSDIPSRYQIELLDLSSGEALWKKTLTQADLYYDKKLKTTRIKVSFDPIKPQKMSTYQLVMTRLKGQWQWSLSPNKYIDSYTLGELQLDGQLLLNQDLIFTVGKE